MSWNIPCIQAKTSSSSSSSLSWPYKTLAKYLSKSLTDHSVSSIQSALEYLSKSQSTLKSIDGASHEFYQLSHKNTIEGGSAGRVERSAGRVGCCADGLLGCELLDWMDRYMYEGEAVQVGEDDNDDDDDQDTLDVNDRKVVLNVTLEEPLPLRVVVLYEPNYNGGVGMNHGGIDGLASHANENQRRDDNEEGKAARGRYLIIIKDDLEHDLIKTLECLDSTPEFFELDVGLVSGEIASVNRILWVAAQKVLEACWECWRNDNGENVVGNDHSDVGGDGDELEKGKTFIKGTGNDGSREKEKEGDSSKSQLDHSGSCLPALHFVGRSLAGGVATLAAILVDGSIPMPPNEETGTTRTRTSTRGKKRHGGQVLQGGQSHQPVRVP
jgi:hypothetical protein